MEEKQYFSATAEETRLLGKAFGDTLSPGTLVCFRGDLGAGKTTFIRGCWGLWCQPPFVSPTFILMKDMI
jgi:tRNA threonylcarbamoyladenosine biosynthesis protein TsaE